VDVKILKREKHSRDDGHLVELFSEHYKDFECKHSYLVSIEPGKARAKHYHKEKIEVIAPVCGETEIILEDPVTKESTRKTLKSDGAELELVLVPAGIAHAVKNNTKKPTTIIIFSNNYSLNDAIGYEFKVKL
jgi:dTDP-4-dehydrorhamnose 3,5-epimerase-like enzyme